MAAYYNEIEPFAASWLRSLIKAGLIAEGDVDERSIEDVRQDDLRGYTQCHFFAGIGGWSYAARLAGWPDDRPLWTGSCPCQPFSLAGKRKGFDDARHLWPVWRELIRECGPTDVFGEQVASASQWLGLVRGDLEEMGYAVGAIPIEAASAGADHLRDRFWFVADRDQERQHGAGNWRTGRRNEPANGSSIRLANADDARPQGWEAERECSGQRAAWQDGLANSDKSLASEGREQRSGEFGGPRSHQEACNGDLADRDRFAERWGSGEEGRAESQSQREMEGHFRQRAGLLDSGTRESFEWVIGADGKARRVKSGIRLLAHGVSGRVGLLRGFGNAIDPRPASQFIAAYLDDEAERHTA